MSKMTIRKGKIEDSETIASYLMLAMSEIVFEFIGLKSREKALEFLESLVCEKSNQYSYENCWIMENEDGIVAMATVYDGEKLDGLRKPVLARIKSMFNRAINPEDETQSGEIYIDCIAVNPTQQGKGFGSKLLDFLIEEYVEKQNNILGLLVENENSGAKKLYLSLGFKVIGTKLLTGKKMEHLQKNNSSNEY